MSRDDRDIVLNKIKTSKTVNVILISFKAGSVGEFFLLPVLMFSALPYCRFAGLNLTACNNVILVDLWWNPALEVR